MERQLKSLWAKQNIYKLFIKRTKGNTREKPSVTEEDGCLWWLVGKLHMNEGKMSDANNKPLKNSQVTWEEKKAWESGNRNFKNLGIISKGTAYITYTQES